MKLGPDRRPPRPAIGIGLAVLALALSAGAIVVHSRSARKGPPTGRAVVRGRPFSTPAPRGRRVLGRRTHSGFWPSRIEIPAIGVSAPVVALHLASDGTLPAPAQWTRAGWYAGGTRPGDPGPAVIVGHVDSRSGPAVFYRLGELRPGDRIGVTGPRGRGSTYVVVRLERWPKDRFPTRRVYRMTKHPTLRLVTCSGSFDRATGHYRDNTIVYANRAIA
jgi:sortase (surface protein transpeptidase)